jgi:hypothetical protein
MEIEVKPIQYLLKLNQEQLAILISMFEFFEDQMENDWVWRDDNEYGEYLQMFSTLNKYKSILE